MYSIEKQVSPINVNIVWFDVSQTGAYHAYTQFVRSTDMLKCEFTVCIFMHLWNGENGKLYLADTRRVSHALDISHIGVSQ